MQEVTHRSDCRLCGSNDFEPVLPILASPIGDAFVDQSKLSIAQNTYPLDTYLCLGCGHLQNLDIVNPDILFRDYTYRTSASLGLVEHFKNYAKSVVNKLSIIPNSLVVEMGSNDGSLLRAFKEYDLRVVGVDPARMIASQASESGILTIPEFFSTEISQNIKNQHGEASLVCANNVFAHIDNISEVIKGVRKLLSPDGVFVFEVSYAPHMVKNMVFDVIYHEHVSHHSLIPLEKFFRKHDMTLFDVEFIPTKGGSIRGYAQVLSTGQRAQSKQLQDAFDDELRDGADKPEFYQEFYRQIQLRKQKLINYLNEENNKGKVIAAYGASTTTTTLLYHFEIQKFVEFIVDDNPIKIGQYSPGAHIPVFGSTELLNKKPDIVIILAWMYSKPIIERNREYLTFGGEFIVPLPEFTVIRNG